MVETIDDAVELVRLVCAQPGNSRFVRDIRRALRDEGIVAAVRTRDTPTLYRWLMDGFSYQGVSDAVAEAYIRRQGNATWEAIELALASSKSKCPKLESFQTYRACGFRKTAYSCNNPADIDGCPVPSLPLRKGSLNELAFSLFLFLRDEWAGDLVGFIDSVIEEAHEAPIEDQRELLLGDFSMVYGISEKLLSMMLSMLLMAGDPKRAAWVRLGQNMVAIDSLVHNFLHRTGILAIYGLEHRYGSRCYPRKGCAGIVQDLAERIDARQFNRSFPETFPRFVQYAIWSFCAELRLNICNGRRIDDSQACQVTDCPVGDRCSRLPLRPKPVEEAE
jgi:hypothetical protein